MVSPFLSVAVPDTSEEHNQKMVCERKFVAPLSAFEQARRILFHHCLPDPQYPEGHIESIYFDTPCLTSFWEKANGDTLKRKIRVRWYPGIDADGKPFSNTDRPDIDAFFEIKDRLGAARRKQHDGFSMPAALLQHAPLHSPQLHRAFCRQAQVMGIVMGPVLVPTVSIRYHRYRFVCPLTQTRISLDSGIVSDRCNLDVLPDGPVLFSSYVVCEAKSPHYRSWPWSEALFRLGFRSASFSKYGEFVNARIHGGQ